MAVASLFADLSKFYERVRHSILLAEAADEATGFPLELVVALTYFYGGHRTLCFGQAVSEVILAAGTIIPGCSCATTMAKVMLCKMLVGVRKEYEAATLVNVVDDMSLTLVGSEAQVTRVLTLLGNKIISGFTALQVEINLGKTIILTNSDEVAAASLAHWGPL